MADDAPHMPYTTRLLGIALNDACVPDAAICARSDEAKPASFPLQPIGGGRDQTSASRSEWVADGE